MFGGDVNMESDMKILNIYCDGGFGNRFNALVVGLLIAEVGNFKPVIFWPSTNWCRSLFKNIFKNDYDNINQNLFCRIFIYFIIMCFSRACFSDMVKI